MLLFASLIRGANRPIPLMLLELSSLFLFASYYFNNKSHLFSRNEFIFIASLFLVPFLYLIPIPFEWWNSFPGMALYGDILKTLDNDGGHSIALYQGVSLYASLALLPPLAVFLIVTSLPQKTIKRLCFLLIGIAVLQSILALIQFAQGPDSIFRFGMVGHPHSGLGTFPNRNHLAGFLEMVFPLALIFLFLYFLRGHRNQKSRRSFSYFFNAKNLLMFSIVVIILLGLIFSRSRTGLALLMIGVVLVALFLWRLLDSFSVNKLAIVSALMVVTLAAEIGLAPVLERFTQQDPLSDLRWIINAGTWEGIKTFFPFGAGPGSYPYIYPRFQSEEITAFVNHAHNDYLEWLFEIGIFGLCFIIMGFWLFFNRWRELFREANSNNFIFIQTGAGIGIILILLHSLVDFNLRIPANAIYFAFLAGIFFHRSRN